MSQIIRFHQTGGPEVLQYETVDVGKPGPGEVHIKVEAIGLNRAEAMFRAGAYLEDPDLPTGLGCEGAGIIESVGPDVVGLDQGDKVSVIPAFSMNDYNLYGERAIVPARAVVTRPEGLNAIDAAAVWMPYLTAYGALIDVGHLSTGQAVLLPAASSSVGLAAIQIANSVGAVSIATTRTPAKVGQLKQAGAMHVIVTEEQDVAAEAERITGGKGVYMVFDPVAGPETKARVASMDHDGLYVVYGALSGETTPFPVIMGLNKALTMRGYTLFEITGDTERFAGGQQFVAAGLAAGDFRPTVGQTFSFDEMVEAHEYMESNRQFGKIVVTVP